SALGAVFWRSASGARCGRGLDGGRLTAVVFAQSRDGIQQLAAVPKRGDAQLLQVLSRQARKNRLVYVILAECRLILPEAQAPQPDHDVHDGAPHSGLLHIIVPSWGECPGGPKGPWIGGFGVNRCRCQKQCQPRWRRIRCQSVSGAIGNCATSSLLHLLIG